MPGTGELFVIMVIVLVLFGPDKLPDLARQAGRFIRKVNRMKADVQGQINAAMFDDDEDERRR